MHSYLHSYAFIRTIYAYVHTGKLWQWLEEQEKAKEETDRLKMQMMNEQAQELYNKKMEDKRKKEQDAEGY
jgi:hypothetical protein